MHIQWFYLPRLGKNSTLDEWKDVSVVDTSAVDISVVNISFVDISLVDIDVLFGFLAYHVNGS